MFSTTNLLPIRASVFVFILSPRNNFKQIFRVHNSRATETPTNITSCQIKGILGAKATTSSVTSPPVANQIVIKSDVKNSARTSNFRKRWAN